MGANADALGPLEHVARPMPPWRRAEQMLTECGLNASDHPTISRDEFIARRQRWGQQRVAMVMCMTCCGAFDREAVWTQDPVAVVRRETYGQRAFKDNPVFREELWALAALVAAHREEFDALLDGSAEAARFAALRQARARRARREKRL
jgi:hypothetical protein